MSQGSQSGEVSKDESSFMCKTCSKCFEKKSNLVAHRRVHTGAMPYHCVYCSRNFKWLSSCRAHERGCHRRVTHYPPPRGPRRSSAGSELGVPPLDIQEAPSETCLASSLAGGCGAQEGRSPVVPSRRSTGSIHVGLLTSPPTVDSAGNIQADALVGSSVYDQLAVDPGETSSWNSEPAMVLGDLNEDGAESHAMDMS